MMKFIVIMSFQCAEIQRCMSADEPHAAARTVSVFGEVSGGGPMEVIHVSWPPVGLSPFMLFYLSVCCPAGVAARHDVRVLVRRYRWWRFMRRIRRGADEVDLL